MEDFNKFCHSHSGMVEKLAYIEKQVNKLDDVFEAISYLRLDLNEHKTKVSTEARSTARFWSGLITTLGILISLFYKQSL